MPWICGLAAFFLYRMSGAGSLFWGDAGEFTAAARTLGIGHAYGHPLFWLAGRIAILLLPSDPAHAMNLLTALSASAVCVVIAFWTLGRCKDRLQPAACSWTVLLVTLLYALSPTVWTQATFTEVYHFQALFLVLSFYFWDQAFFFPARHTALFAGFYFFGLAATLGYYVLPLILIPVLLWILRVRPDIRISHMAAGAAFFLLGLTIWLYLPVRSALNPAFMVMKVDSLPAFIRYLTRASFAHIRVAGSAGIGIALRETLKSVVSNTGAAAVLFFFFWLAAPKEERRTPVFYAAAGLGLFLMFGLMIPFQFNFRQMVDMDVYFIPVFLVLVPVMAAGATSLARIMKKSWIAVLLIPLAVITGMRWKNIDISGSRTVTRFQEYLAIYITAGSTVFPVSDEVAHPLMYHLYGLGNADNFRLITRAPAGESAPSGEAVPPADSLVRFIEIEDPVLERFISGLGYLSAGPFLASPGDTVAARNLEEGLEAFSPDSVIPDRSNRLDRQSLARIWARKGVEWYFRYSNAPDTQGTGLAFGKAVLAFTRAFRFDDSSFEGALHAGNLALAYAKSGRMGEAEHYALKAVRLNPLEPAPYRVLYTAAVQRNEWPRALGILKKLTLLIPNDPEIDMNAAALLLLMNQPGRAREAYERALKKGGSRREEIEKALSNGRSIG